jgi:hypothetical protein
MQEQQPRPFGRDVKPEQPGKTMMDEPEEQATEEEQAQYTIVVSRAVKLFHGSGRDQTLKMLASGESPADSIGRTAAMTIRMIKKSADEAGKPIDDGILYHAGVEIVEELFEYGTQANVFQFADAQEAQEQHDEALFYALKYYGEEALAAGEIDQGEMQKAMQQGIQQEQSAKVGGAVRQAMDGPQTPPQGAGIAKDKAGMINAARGGA